MILLLGRHHCQEESMRIHMWSVRLVSVAHRCPVSENSFISEALLTFSLFCFLWQSWDKWHFPHGECGAGAQSILSARYNWSLHSHCLMLSKESGYEFIYCLHDENMCSVAEGTSWVIYCFICTTSISGCTESLLDTQLLDKPVHET